MIQKKYIHFYLIALFTILQLLVLFCFGYTPYPDSEGFELIANESLSYGQPYPAKEILNTIPFIWNLGAINLVELSLFLFGSAYPLLIFNAFLKGLSAYLLYIIAENIFSRNIALATLILFVIYPSNYDCTSFHSELPFTFFVLLGIALTLKKKSLLGGSSLALASYIRPMGICFLLAMCVFQLLNRGKYKLRQSVMSITGYILVVLIIGSLTYLRTGHFIYQAKTGWMALMQYSWDKNRYQEEDKHLFLYGDPIYNDTLKTNVFQRDSIWRSNFIKWVQARPCEYVRQMPEKIVRTYISDNVNMCTFLSDKSTRTYLYEDLDMESIINDFPYSKPLQWITLINLTYYYFLMMSFLFFLYFTVKAKTFKSTSLLFFIALFNTAIIVLVGHGEARFHIPLMPFFIMGAAWVVYNKTHIAQSFIAKLSDNCNTRK